MGRRVGILGSGDVAQTLGDGFLGLGDEVLLGTRHPDAAPLQRWRAAGGERAHVGSFADAARFGPWVVVSTHGTGTLEAIHQAGPEAFRGKLVIDTTNPLVFSETAPPVLYVGTTDSLGEQVQKALPGASVVKAFNIIGKDHMVHPAFGDPVPTMLIAGDSAEAKRSVTELLHQFGWADVVDVGGIQGARALEGVLLAWMWSALALKSWDVGFRLLRKPGPA